MFIKGLGSCLSMSFNRLKLSFTKQYHNPGEVLDIGVPWLALAPLFPLVIGLLCSRSRFRGKGAAGFT